MCDLDLKGDHSDFMVVDFIKDKVKAFFGAKGQVSENEKKEESKYSI